MKKVFFITLAIILPIITFDIFSPKIKDARTFHQLDMAMSFTSAAATIRFDAFDNVTNTNTGDEFAIWSTSAENIRNITFSNLENDIDHGALQGLTDDDHAQYMKESVYDPNIDGIIDISSATNLTAGTGITISGDTVLVQDIYVLTAGDTMTGDLLMSGANVDLGTFSAGGGQLLSGSSTILHVTGTRQLFLGLGAGNFSNAANDNIGIGYQALRNVETGGADNVAVGVNALDQVTTGDNNTGIGTGACQNVTTGNDNTCLGDASGSVNTTGSYNVAVGTGAMGLGSGTDVDSNTAVGDIALEIIQSDGNVGVGDSAGRSFTTGGNTTSLGYLAGNSSTATVAKSVVIGYNAQVTSSNTMVLGGTGATDNVDVVIGATAPISSARFTINGEEDQIQALIQGHSTQTSDLMQMENSAGVDVFRVTNAGNFVVTGSSVTFAGFDCSGNSNGGALTVDANGDLSCTDDDSGGAGGGTTIDVQDSGSAIVSTSTVSFNGPLVATNSGGDAQVTISDGSIDISQYTNLTAGTGITLSGDTVLVQDIYALHAGDVYSGTHDFTSATVTVATASADDSDTSVSSTAFVQQEINGAGGTNLTCSGGQCNVDDVFVLNTGDTISGTFTLSSGTVDVSGGDFVIASGTTLPVTCVTGEHFLDTDADTNGSLYSCVATNTWKEVDDDGGAGGTPGGSDTQIQYNNSSSFGGISTFTYDGTDLTLSAEMIVTGTMDVSGGDLEIPNSTTLPSSCEAGEIYMDTNATSGQQLYGCESGSFVLQGGGGSDTNSVKENCWNDSQMLPISATSTVAPVYFSDGTTIDALGAAYADDLDECRCVNTKVPSDITSGSTVTFRKVWYSEGATSGNIIWDVRHNARSEGEDWDASLTTETAAADATQGTVDQETHTTWTETLSNLGWAANDDLQACFCRDADNGSDTLSGDAIGKVSCIEMPRE